MSLCGRGLPDGLKWTLIWRSVRIIMDAKTLMMAHYRWRLRLRAAISRHEKLDLATVADGKQCEIGQWLATGSKLLDEQHKELFRRCSSLVEAYESGMGKERIAEMQTRLSKP
jgi:hypothetical protein